MTTAQSSTIHQLIIIGSGPAGLTAALYAARANLNPLIIEGPKPGGQLMSTTAIENWPGNLSQTGPALMLNMIEQVKKLNVPFISGSVSSTNFSTQPFTVNIDNKKQLQAHSIIIATGATPNRLNCLGEDIFWGNGVSTCAVCDGAFYKNQHVVVVGGGDSSMESASFLLRNENKVTIVHIGETLTASHAMQKKVINQPNISIIYNSTVTEIHGQDKVSSIAITHQKTKQSHTVSTDGVFLAIGLKPNSYVFKEHITCSSLGHIQVHDHVKTSTPGIFAAGDIQDYKYRQAIVSAGFGCMAALEAERYLSHQTFTT